MIKYLGGGFKYFFIFTPKIGEDSHFDEHIFRMGWFNHQLDMIGIRLHLGIYKDLSWGQPKLQIVTLLPGFGPCFWCFCLSRVFVSGLF